ncbi:MAG: GIY-YIG nuclease family protein [Candidatus Obscuribacterales bacterium]|nr:GIY-YIG nuclease family protein [Candidatus Obscuribacterales bacterium]
MNLKSHEFIFFDCQSTGASPGKGNVLEMAWSKCSAENEPDKLEAFLIKQPEGQSIPFMIQNLTGIVDADMEKAVDEHFAYSQFLEQFHLSGNQENRIALIHYARFEQAFLRDINNRHSQNACMKEGAMLVAECAESPIESALPFKIICTYEIARRLFPNLPTRGINGIAGFFGAHMPEIKRADCHVKATWSIWKGLAEELEKQGILTLSQLDDWMTNVPATKRTKVEYPLEKQKRASLPNAPGVYRMLDRNGKILYVGKATSLKSRVNSYFRGKKGKDAKRLEMLTRVNDLKVTVCNTRLEAAILETDEIKYWNPPYNIALKTGRRQLVYYNRELTLWQHIPDSIFCIGPFSSTYLLEPLLRLSTSLHSGEFDASIFFDHIEPDLLEAGFSYFVQYCSLQLSDTSPRTLMAAAIKMYREQMQIAVQQQLLGSEPDDDDLEETAESEEEEAKFPISLDDISKKVDAEDEGEAEELTVEEVGAKFQRLFFRAARVYLQSKALHSLLNATVEFCDTGVEQRLRIERGQIFPSAAPSGDVRPATQIKLENIDLVTYDRMRVLLAELGRIQVSGATYKIISDSGAGVPAWLLGRNILA